MMVDLDDVGGLTEVAEALDLTLIAVRRLTHKRKDNGCPGPLKHCQMGNIYSISEWRGWMAFYYRAQPKDEEQ